MTYGGVLLIHRDWFKDLNQFDDNLEIWGGESVELSIKSWLCGGPIELVPCSRIGHIFRKKHPYAFPQGSSARTVLANTKRIAENWLDDYQKFYYMERPQAKEQVVAEGLDRNATAAALKNRLQCRPFSWYLRVVFPQLKIPNEQNVAYGELQQGDHQCLQISAAGNLQLIDCFSDDQVTTWTLQNSTNLLSTTSGACLTAYSDLTRVALEMCRPGRNNKNYKAQQWFRARGNLINLQTRMCLENLGRTVAMSSCRTGATSQLWHFSVEIEQQSWV